MRSRAHHRASDAAGTPVAAQGPASRPASPRAEVVFLTNQGQVRVTVEVARSTEERRRGLMYRQYLDPMAGMLFVFPETEVQTFWMKNTLLPLDMIFIGEDLAVVGVIENAVPLDTSTRAINARSRYVLEVNGGFAKRHGIAAGSKVTFQNIALP